MFMMKNTFMIIFFLFFTSCAQKGNDEKTQTFRIGDGSQIKVIDIDGCEYLFGPWGNATVLTHKGNCKNHEKTQN